jgi:pyruvate-formate lyase-activating enzyme
MDICLWDKCNNKCLMCTNPDWPWPAWDGSFKYDYQSLVKRIKKSEKEIKKKYDSIYLSGGEPTLHPRFLELLEFIGKLFPEQRIKLLTNGRKFLYKDFAQRTLDITDNLDIELSIYGSNEKNHQAVTRASGSFEQTIQGLANLLDYKKEGQLVNVRFVITKFSYKSLGEFLKMMKSKFPKVDRIMLIFWEVENQAVKNIKAVKATYCQVSPYLEKIYPLLNDFKEIRLYHFPLCVVSEKFWPYLWRTLDKDDVVFSNACQECAYKKYCLGIPKKYSEHLGIKEFKPIKKNLKIQERKNIYQPILSVSKK